MQQLYYEDSFCRLYNGDCLDILKGLPDNSVQCCVTSPPYWGLRDYGVSGQIGLEETPFIFVEKMVEVFEEVRRVLKNDGTLWLNFGDTYSAHKDCKSISQTIAGGTSRERAHVIAKGKSASRNSKMLKSLGLKNKELVGIPWRVAFALQESGWWLRQDIIWAKPNPMPESVTDRCTKAHEYIFLLTKTERYYFDQDAIRERAVTVENRPYGVVRDRAFNYKSKQKLLVRPKNPAGCKRKEFSTNHGGGGKGFVGHSGNYKADGTPLFNPLGRNKRSVWTINSEPFKDAHFATFPTKLVEPCILAGSKVGDTVLDPFMGSGTTAFVAKNLGRRVIGAELNAGYLAIAVKRLPQEVFGI